MNHNHRNCKERSVAGNCALRGKRLSGGGYITTHRLSDMCCCCVYLRICLPERPAAFDARHSCYHADLITYPHVQLESIGNTSSARGTTKSTSWYYRYGPAGQHPGTSRRIPHSRCSSSALPPAAKFRVLVRDRLPSRSCSRWVTCRSTRGKWPVREVLLQQAARSLFVVAQMLFVHVPPWT